MKAPFALALGVGLLLTACRVATAPTPAPVATAGDGAAKLVITVLQSNGQPQVGSSVHCWIQPAAPNAIIENIAVIVTGEKGEFTYIPEKVPAIVQCRIPSATDPKGYTVTESFQTEGQVIKRIVHMP